MILFNSKDIVIDGSPFFFKTGSRRGLYRFRIFLESFCLFKNSEKSITSSVTFYNTFKSSLQSQNTC